jgi:glycosyltransferase involved in cell wall biosynthesis
VSKFLGFAANLVPLFLTLRKRQEHGPYFKVVAAPSFQGGPATKLGQLGPLLAPAWSPYSAVFCFSAVQTPLALLRLLKSRGARIVVNQNGVYYPSWYPRGWERKNRYLAELNALADFSFFQSEFALESYRKFVGEPPAAPKRAILHNGVDLKRFQPRATPAAQPTRVLVFADVSELTRPLWKHVLALQRKLPEQAWVFMGRIHDRRVFEELGLNRNGAENYFDWPAARVPEVLRSCDVALHLVYNDVCPNKALECMASGLWVIGLSAGGTAELVGDGGAILAVKHGFDAPDFPSLDALAAELEKFRARARECRERAVARAAKFDLAGWHRAVNAVVQ